MGKYDEGDGTHVPLNTFTDAGQILVSRTNGEPVALPIGEDDQVLGVEDGTVAWVDASGGGGAFAVEQVTFTLDSQMAHDGNDDIAWTDTTTESASITWDIGDPTEINLAAGVYLVDVAVLVVSDNPNGGNTVILKLDGVNQLPIFDMQIPLGGESTTLGGTRTLRVLAPAVLTVNVAVQLSSTASIEANTAVVVTRIA